MFFAGTVIMAKLTGEHVDIQRFDLVEVVGKMKYFPHMLVDILIYQDVDEL